MEHAYSILGTLRDFVVKANKLSVDYMVTGSFAMSAYGEIRYTRDIDIVIQIDRADVAGFASAFADKYYVSDLSIERAIDHRSIFNMVNLETGEKIDCIIQKDTEFARVSFGRRRRAIVSGIEFWTTTKEDLMIAKLNWARESHSEMQIRDIANLSYDEYESTYVAGWVEILGLSGIWNEVLKWKIHHPRSDN